MEPAPIKPSAPDPPDRPTPKDGPAHHWSKPTRNGGDDSDGPGSRHKAVSASSGGQGGSRGQGGSLASPAGDAQMASSFAGHYGQLIISEGIAPIPRALYLYQGALNLSPQQVWFVSCVLAHKWDGYLPHPSLQEIARHATLGLRQVKKIKNSIVHAGLLEVRPRYGSDGEQDANSYDFGMLFDRLERLMLADRSAPEDELAEGSPHDGPGHGSGHVEQFGHGPGVEHRETSDPAETVSDTTITNKREQEKETEKRNVKDYSFAARFGRVVLRRGVSTVPKALFVYQSQLSLSPQQMWFIGYILSFQWSTELPYPSLRKMASNTGYSERQIHRIKDSLVSAGYLRVIERRAADGADTTSAYDFTALLKSLSALIRKHTVGAKRQAGGANWAGRQMAMAMDMEIGEVKDSTVAAGAHSARQTSPQLPFGAPGVGGERHVSGRVNATSVEGEPDDPGRVNSMSGEGVNSASVEGVNCTSYEIESIKEAYKEEPPQQQATDIAANDEAQEDRDSAYDALVDVGVIPGIALDLAGRMEPEQILDWVRYYLSVLSKQDNLINPIGVLVSRLRSGEEPPCVPSPGDLQSLRFKLSRYR